MDIRVARELGDLGYETFVAWTFSRSKFAGRAFAKAELRLSPYVFVRVEYSRQNFRTVLDTNGVESAVSLRRDVGDSDMHPSEIPERVISGMRQDQIEDFEAAIRRVRRRESMFEVGALVTIRDGSAFDGIQGVVRETRPHAVIIEVGSNGFPLRVAETDIVPVTTARTPFGRAGAQ